MDNLSADLPLVIEQYQFIEHIGRGGYGCVYKVLNQKYKDPTIFAAKVLGCNCAKWNICSLMFSSEVKALQNLDHPNIIRLYDFFGYERAYVIILEYCPGGSLRDLIKNDISNDENKLLNYASQIIDALSFCHKMGVCHRDLKPSNVLVDQNGRLKLADFGFSRVFHGEKENTFFPGSLPYSSPEILLQKEYCPFQSDIWSLGVMLYEMATSSLPWPCGSVKAMKKAILSGEFDLSRVKNLVLKEMIGKMLQVDPLNRISRNKTHSV